MNTALNAYKIEKTTCFSHVKWHDLMSSSVVTGKELTNHLPVDQGEINAVTDLYPMRINPYFLSLIKKKEDPLWRQVVPDLEEINDRSGVVDPLNEKGQSPVPNLIHRYPGRVLFMISDQCAVLCRFCMRKKNKKGRFSVTKETIDDGIQYIKGQKTVNEVILSGGDPLLCEDGRLISILERLHRLSHVRVLRIHTRTPGVLPQRITSELAERLKKFHPLYMHIHFNHPDEITPSAVKACNMLSDAGIPLGSQTVFLKGVNNDIMTIKNLMERLIQNRIKPYYIHQLDPIKGTVHFKSSLQDGLKIMKGLRGTISGLCLPHYMIDLPGGKGKVPLFPDQIIQCRNNILTVENYKGELSFYPL